MLKRGGLNRQTYAVHNVLSCRPPNNWLVGAPWEQDAISHCAPYLDRTIRDQNPKVLVALGNTALHRLVSDADGIQRHRGFVLVSKDGRFVVPTFHPSYLLPRAGQENTSRFVGVVVRDLRKAHRIAQEGFRRTPLHYLLDAPAHEFAMWIAEFQKWARSASWPLLAFDIETQSLSRICCPRTVRDVRDLANSGVQLPAGTRLVMVLISKCIGQFVLLHLNGVFPGQICCDGSGSRRYGGVQEISYRM